MNAKQVMTSAVALLVGLFLTSIANGAGLKRTATTEHSLQAVDKLGYLWGTDQTHGAWGGQVVKFSGSRGSFSYTPYSGSDIYYLKPKGGLASHLDYGSVKQSWPLPDGNLLFATTVGGKGYLYKLRPTTNSVGNNAPAYDNQEAVMNIGERPESGHPTDIRTLQSGSMSVATVQGATVLFFGEYNVSSEAGWVALWKSTNLGDTWTKVIEWNTVGHQTRHIHGVRQNPYNGWIYILLGDSDEESGILAWDGVSAPPPDNTPLGDIGNYPGWRSIAGSQAVRTGDIVFTPSYCVWIPDVDEIASGETLHGMRSNHDLSGLRVMGSVPYTNGIPPILGHKDSKGVIYWSSFKINDAPELHVWISSDSGNTWKLSQRVRVYNSGTGVPHSLFVAPWGELVLSGIDASGIQLTPYSPVGSAAYFKRTK